MSTALRAAEFQTQMIHHWIEAFKVPNLHNAVAALGEPGQRARILDGGSHRLFQQHVASTGAKQMRRDLEMGDARRGDGDDVEILLERMIIATRCGAIPRGEVRGARRIDVHNQREPDARKSRILRRMKAPQAAGADHRGTKLTHVRTP